MRGSYTAPTDRKFDDGLNGLNPQVHRNSAFDMVSVPPTPPPAALFVDALFVDAVFVAALAAAGVTVVPRSPIVAATAITKFRFAMILLL
jgi:hypothetical protein